MDEISNANEIIWLFLGTVLYYLLTVVFSLGIWAESERISKISYLANVLSAAVISFCNVEIVFASAAHEPEFLKFLAYGKAFAILEVILFCGSIIFQKRNHKILRNILLNISTIGGLALFTYLIQMKY